MQTTLVRARRWMAVLCYIAAAVSLVCFLRALSRDDELILTIVDDALHSHSFSLFGERGRVGVRWSEYELHPGYTYIDPSKPQSPRIKLQRVSAPSPADMVVLEMPRFLEYRLRSANISGVAITSSMSVSCMFLVVLAIPLPVYDFRRSRQARAFARLGKCPRCGYDLRATPGFCPECGPTPTRPQHGAGSERPLKSGYTPLVGATQFLTEKKRARGERVERLNAPPRS